MGSELHSIYDLAFVKKLDYFYFCCCAVKRLLKYATGLNSNNFSCDTTPPTPILYASASNLNGKSKYGRVSTWSVISAVRSTSNEIWQFSFHSSFTPFVVAWTDAAAILAKLGMNLRENDIKPIKLCICMTVAGRWKFVMATNFFGLGVFFPFSSHGSKTLFAP